MKQILGTLIKGPLEGLEPHPENRKFTDESLATLQASIAANGILEPIQYRIIKRKGKEVSQILHGHRRARAAVLAGLTEAPMLKVSATDEEALCMVLVANMERADLDVIEQAEMVRALSTIQVNQEKIAALLARDVSWVQLNLAMAVQPEPVKKAIREKRMSPGAVAESMAVEERFRKVAEQKLLDLASAGYQVNDSFAKAQIEREVEGQKAAVAWETGKKDRALAYKEILKAQGWTFKLIHRRYDEPLDGSKEWAGPGEKALDALLDVGVTEMGKEFQNELIGDLANEYGNVAALIVPRRPYDKDGPDCSTEDSVLRLCLDQLVVANAARPEADRWFTPPPELEEEPEEEDDGLDWKERNRLASEKRKNRKSEIDRVLEGMAAAIIGGEKRVLKQFRNAYADEIWDDAMGSLADEHGELLYPVSKNDDEAKERLTKLFEDAPIVRKDLWLVESLRHLLSDIQSLEWNPESAERIIEALDLFPDGPAKDAALAMARKIKEGEL